MKRLLSVFFLTTTLSTMVLAQDSSVSQEPPATESKSGYGGYGGRAEVFVTGFGSFSNQANGNAIGEQATEAGGASVGYRFHLNSSSALEGRYGFNRNSQKYTIGSTVSSIPAYVSEISGSYVYNFAKSRRIQPFLEGGGGLVLFSPGNYGGGTTASGAGNPTNNSGPAQTAYVGVAYPAYGSGSPTSLARQAKGMFLYGVGADVPALSHLFFRLEFRGLGYKTPDFGAVALHTDTFSFVYEPSVGVAYRF
jgi:hypothetical protein